MRKLVIAIMAGMMAGMSWATAEVPKVQLMFVQVADNIKVDATTLRLVGVQQQTLYFSDRPVRVAGHLTMAGYLDEWKATEGPNNFGSNPPNATSSVYEPGQRPIASRWSSSAIRSSTDTIWSTTIRSSRARYRRRAVPHRCS